MFTKKIERPKGEEETKEHQFPLAEKPFRKRERGTEEIKGSRWAGLVLLLATVIASLLFYLRGQFSRKEIRVDEILGTQTYHFEK